MRNLFLVMLVAFATALSSCSKNSQTAATSQTTSTDTGLPSKASEYIDTNYPDASVLYVVTQTNSDASYLVTLNTSEELAFNGEGNFLGDGARFHGGHHGDTIFRDSIHCDTIHGGPGHGGHGGGHHGGPHPGNYIPIDSLSQVIKDYVTANYSGYIIRHAEYDSICPEGLVIEVVIGIAGQEPEKLIFDPSDNFIMLDNRILYADVPQAVKDYITANYAAYKACQRATKLTLADSSIQYIIHLRLQKQHLTVRLKEDGTLVCTR